MTKTETVTTASETDTEQFGRSLGEGLSDGVCIALCGALGPGKSVLARGICKGLGVGEEVLSPSFVLFEEYSGRFPVIHTDFYRLEHESEIEALGVFERIGDGSVVIAEWADRSPWLLGAADIIVELKVVGENERQIEVTRR